MNEWCCVLYILVVKFIEILILLYIYKDELWINKWWMILINELMNNEWMRLIKYSFDYILVVEY